MITIGTATLLCGICVVAGACIGFLFGVFLARSKVSA